MTEVLTAVLPSLGVLGLFLLGLRAMLHADRRERAAEARLRGGRAAPAEEVEPAPGPPQP